MSRLVPALAALVLPGSLAWAMEGPLTKPGVDLAVITTPHLRLLVPAGQAEALRSLADRTEVLYTHLAREAGYTITQPLTILISDDADDHNGYSTVVPTPLVQVELAPSLPRSGIFTGADETERTLVHELTHHLANDRNHGFRQALETVFGRIFPNDPLSLLAAYLSVPAHVTMPGFWQEGTAQWAETAYADPSSPWAGRGRDSLSHLVWRLDADAGTIPQPEDWRATYPAWPYGNRVYLYGLAYLRWLAGTYGDQAVWTMIGDQGRQWAFAFDKGAVPATRQTHGQLIQRAREDLLAEQQAILARLRTHPLTSLTRLTAEDHLVAAPAWLPDGRLLTAYHDPYGVPSMVLVDAQGHIEDLDLSAWDRGEARSLPDGTAIWAEAPQGANPWSRSRLVLREADGDTRTLAGSRLLQPDVRRTAIGLEAVALRIETAGHTSLVAGAVTLHRFGASPVDWAVVPTQGRPWHPTFRPGTDELCWVETDHDGSRLVLAPRSDPTRRTVLASVRGRLIHPSWTADGRRVFVCADHTGVPNAWYVDAAEPGTLHPVTSVLGGVVACVPSPDGRELALVAYDRHGNFLARIPADPATWVREVPEITLAWPAPVGPLQGPPRAPATPLPRETPVSSAPPETYHGLTAVRPLFWTPTTQVTPVGGLGAVGVAADPVNTHQVIAGLGGGDHDGTFVGLASYTCAVWPLQVGLVAWRDERAYDNQLVDSTGRTYDLVDSTGSLELRLGHGLAGLHKRFQAYVALGRANTEETQPSQDRHEGRTLVNAPTFAGHEAYVEGTLAFSSNLLFPTSYTREDGTTLAATYRYSALGQELEGQRLVLRAAQTISLWPEGGHQLVAGGLLGWTSENATRTLQGRFSIGPPSPLGFPRGYNRTFAVGDYLLGWTLAYRFPLWRPFSAYGSAPLVFRQLVAEAFMDGAKVSFENLRAQAPWYRSVGGELHADYEIWALRLAPGLGVAKQLDGPYHDTVVYLTLQFAW